MSGLPSGLTFTESDRSVSGTPDTAGVSTVTYSVTDSASPAATRTQTFTVTINPVPTPPSTPGRPSLTSVSHDSISLSWGAVAGATHYDARYRDRDAGGVGVPGDWLHNDNIRDTARTFTGLTPSTRYEFEVRAGNAAGASAWSLMRYGTTSAAPVPLTLPDPSDRTLTQGEEASFTLPEASGGTSPYTYSVSGLPSGLAFTESDRSVSGTPNTAGVSTVTYRVEDSASPAATRTQTFTVTITSTPTPFANLRANPKTIRLGQTTDVVASDIVPEGVRTKFDFTEHLARDTCPSGSASGRQEVPEEATITLTGCIEGDAIVRLLTFHGNVEMGSINITVDSMPKFQDESTARSVPENTAEGVAIGGPVSATDPDGDDLTYSLSGTDAASFAIDSGTGQLRTRAALNYEVKSSYSVTIGVTDGKDAQGDTEQSPTVDDTIIVTINVTDVNEPPGITVGPGSVNQRENSVDVATYTATDPDDDTISWLLPNTLHETDRGDFRISSSGLLTFRNPPDYENPVDANTDNVYLITIRASDGNGRSDDRNVTITVTDVNEPPGKPSAPTVTPNSETSLNVTWSAPPNTGPPINDYDVQYRVGNSGSFTSATHTGTATQTTISNLNPGTAYEVQVRAKNVEGTSGWSESGNGSTDMEPLPTVTIVSQSATVTEGQEVRFTLTASPAPAADLTVNVSVTDPGAFLTGTVPSEKTIASGSTTVQLSLQTADDSVDEVNGVIGAAVQPGMGYSVGSPPSASVTVEDDDLPPTPTGLRANGSLDGGNVTLRWAPVSGATGYNVRYAEEVCSSNGACRPNGWLTPGNISTSGSAVVETTLGGLTEDTLYRVEVQAVIVDSSDWSDFALVFPTDSPLGSGTEVATAPFHGYQAKNAQGSHEFRYVLCDETIPTTLKMTAQDMKNAVDEWGDTVTWNRSGANIITTMAYDLPAGERCSRLAAIPVQDGRFEVKFASNTRVRDACAPLKIYGEGPPGCWRSISWSRTGINLIESGAIHLNAEFKGGASHWDGNNASGRCKRLHELIVHEVGHAFGIGSRIGMNYNRHPVNDTRAIMSYANTGDYCEPQAYDIVAAFALYQSR